MKIGDLVLDKIINEMGIVIDVLTEPEEHFIVQLGDGTQVLTSIEDARLIVSGSLL
tara:strand:- start:690 stop:857 length:168 start_codon:yes stop_codon:yes gene_type:complete